MNDSFFSSTKMTYPWQKAYMSPNKGAVSEKPLSPSQPDLESK
jgi:hypothetical protein